MILTPVDRAVGCYTNPEFWTSLPQKESFFARERHDSNPFSTPTYVNQHNRLIITGQPMTDLLHLAQHCEQWLLKIFWHTFESFEKYPARLLVFSFVCENIA